MLKAYSSSISSRLAAIINASFKSGKVQSDWKVSRVISIFKKGDAGLVSNYRLISLPSLVGKFQEWIVHETLLIFLLFHNAISPSQLASGRVAPLRRLWCPSPRPGTRAWTLVTVHSVCSWTLRRPLTLCSTMVLSLHFIKPELRAPHCQRLSIEPSTVL